MMGASSGWRSINTASGQQGGRVDLLAGQRTQLGRYTEGTAEPGQERDQEMYGSRSAGRSSNAMEINKIAQCSKMVPGMSGSEIRSVLEAVNWDTSIAVKNLKIDKLYRQVADVCGDSIFICNFSKFVLLTFCVFRH